ncbi:MAG: response regulator [Desulfobulbaceae bacterium]|nr:response regulator [Desulfobulbaceae bacterium]
MSRRILVVDDEILICKMVSRWLEGDGYESDIAGSAGEALQLLKEKRYDLLISDINMPQVTGIELLQKVKELYPEVAVIMATAVDQRDTAIHALLLGAYAYIIKPFHKNEFLINVVNALERRRLTIESKRHREILEEEVRERTADIRNREEEIALHLISAAGHRDEETGEHIKRLGLYSVAIAEALGWDQERIDYIRVAAPMHDVGKIGIPDKILQKPGKLSSDEYEIIKGHTTIGGDILGGTTIPLLQMAKDIALFHHEKWDGTGYPQGLRGEDIPQAARIVAIADVYDALSHDRIYRKAYSEPDVLSIIGEKKGSHFDPAVFECFRAILPEMGNILEEYTDAQGQAGQGLVKI